jgi:Uma2 family endonuclease
MPQSIERQDVPPRLANRKKFTETDCDFLERSGLLDDRYELIEGDIVHKMPQKNPHRLTVIRLIAWLTTVFPPDLVGTQATVRLSATSLPEPDGFVLASALPADRDYPESEDVLMAIEVSDSTLADDLGTKARLYASAGIVEYWVVDIVGRRLIVHRIPTEDGYEETFACFDTESLAPLARPESAILVSNLLPPEPSV